MIRTLDPLVPNEVRYQAALHSDDRMSKVFSGFLPTKSEGCDPGKRRTGESSSRTFESLEAFACLPRRRSGRDDRASHDQKNHPKPPPQNRFRNPVCRKAGHVKGLC